MQERVIEIEGCWNVKEFLKLLKGIYRRQKIGKPQPTD